MSLKGNPNNFKASLRTHDTSVKSSLQAKIARETTNPKIATVRATRQPATHPMALCSEMRCPYSILDRPLLQLFVTTSAHEPGV